jgi:hypothetical protein
VCVAQYQGGPLRQAFVVQAPCARCVCLCVFVAPRLTAPPPPYTKYRCTVCIRLLPVRRAGPVVSCVCSVGTPRARKGVVGGCSWCRGTQSTGPCRGAPARAPAAVGGGVLPPPRACSMREGVGCFGGFNRDALPSFRPCRSGGWCCGYTCPPAFCRPQASLTSKPTAAVPPGGSIKPQLLGA